MCDIKVLICESCDRRIETHIGDYSADPDAIVVFCHHCKEKALEFLTKDSGGFIVFSDSGCLFVLNLPQSIHLNGSLRESVKRAKRDRPQKSL